MKQREEAQAKELPDPVATGLRGHNIFPYALRSLAFSPDGKLLAAGSGDGTVQLWNVSQATVERTLSAHENWAFAVAFSPDGKTLATGGGDNLVKLWDAATGELQRTLEGHTDDVHAVAFAMEGQVLISAGDDMTVKFWKKGHGRTIR